VVWQRPAPRLDLRVRGRLPLAVLTAGRTEVREAEGFVNLDARVTGTTAAPDFTGEGTVSDGHLAFRDYPDSLRALRGRFTISPQALRVAELTASLGGGEVRARGDLALRAAGVGAYRFTIGARGVAMEMFDGFASTWNADLELVGHEARSQLRGDAHLVRGLYTTETPLLRLLLTRQGAARAAGPPGGLPLDIRVHLDDNLAARTSFARARADGTLTIGGTTDAPIVFGTLVAREGHVMFRNQRFTFVAASVRFADPRRIDPTLDVHAQARIRNHDVTLLIRGRTEELEIRASSVPTLPEEDVLSLIAFGQTRAQLGRGGGLGAGGAFAGQAAGLLIEDLFGLEGPGRIVDVVDVETAEDTTRTVTVGKRVTERTLVLYSQGVEKSQERKLRIEYEVVGPLVVAGEQDFRGGFGGDVLVRLRFR
jgi:translocation and assembly module TamB